MCGIAGALALGQKPLESSIDALEQALDAMQHRGPDHRQMATSSHIQLGHRRLSIIDTTSVAHQPMRDHTGRYLLAFNGEIFNYRELKSQLPFDAWQTSSDTEVLLYHLIEHGKHGLQHLNGFFSFCFIDLHARHVLIAKDRMGEKPLYYCHHGEVLYFASELKSILQFPIPKQWNASACSHYLMHGYFPPDQSMVKAVQKLERQQCIELRDGQFACTTWPIESHHPNTDHPTETFRQLFHGAIQRRLIADVPLCSFLSGGIDSSIVTSIAHQYNSQFPAFTLRFNDAPYLDETEIASRFAREKNIKHENITVSLNDLPKTFRSMLEKMDEPFGDSSSLALYSLTQAVGNTYKVALSGDGGDELLGGYRKHMAWQNAQEKNLRNTILAHIPWSLFPVSRFGRENQWSDKWRKLMKYGQLLNTSAEDQYNYLRAFAYAHDLRQISTKLPIWKDATTAYTLNEFLLADQYWVLQGDMLTKTDRCGMWSSLEIRSPFMDPTVVGFCNALPPEWKIANGRQKRLIYESFYDEIPAWLWQAPKRGFEIPLQSCFPKLISALDKEPLHLTALEKDMYKALNCANTPVYLRYNLLVLLYWLQLNPGISIPNDLTD